MDSPLQSSTLSDIQIKLVHVEFLRAGPPHNQLLSPLTEYLAISGDSGAGVVSVPYEHAAFERRLRELRYETGAPADRQAMLHTTGVEMGRILGSVPGLPGALASDPNHTSTLVHLRITLSPSELALLPFEIAKVPVSPAVTGESCLSIQTRPPICITRNIRTVSAEGVVWPDRPRILFIAGDPDYVPYEDHRKKLLEAIQPFRYPRRDDPVRSKDPDREQYGDLLTILINPTLTQVVGECDDHKYTHVHVLAHGDLSETSRDSFGLVLRADDGSADVVSGEQFACALTSVGDNRIHRPTVVTVASCDSANVGTVAVPGASFAHALHQSGIPLVVASQFPLSKDGSIPFAETLYKGLLWGRNPLVLLQQLRSKLHALFTSTWHDWASLVVYEALPQTWSEQLDALRYRQTRRAMNAALERIDIAVRKAAQEAPSTTSFEECDRDINNVVERLPLNGQYGVECLGLRASSLKRLAQAAFTLSEQTPSNDRRYWRDEYELLEEALHYYDQGVRGMLVNEARAVQRIATVHWVLVQFISLSVVLGKDNDEARWSAATFCADLYREHATKEERAWAQGSLAELWLLRLGKPGLSQTQKEECYKEAMEHARRLVAFYPWGDEFPVQSTRRQFDRYVNWWGTERFKQGLAERGIQRCAEWDGSFGLIHTAGDLVKVLRRKGGGPAGNPTAPPSLGPSESGGGSMPPGPASPPGDGGSAASGSSAPVAPAQPGEPAGSQSSQSPTLGPSASGRSPPPPRKSRGAPFFRVEMLPAEHGDALWIEYGDQRSTHRWMIDCGTQRAVKELNRRVEAVPEKERLLELFIMSHIDSDHIGGALPFLKTIKRGLKFGDVWFNGWRHVSGQLGARQGEIFSTAIQEFELPWNRWLDGGTIVVAGDELPEYTLPGGMRLTLLSPTPAQLKKLAPAWTRELKRYGLEPGSRVDYSQFLRGKPSSSTDVDQLADSAFAGDAGVPNGSSIAVLAEFEGASVLLGADAHAPVLAASVRMLLQQRRGMAGSKLKLDAFKVPHHASQNNLSTELLELLDCPRYLVSTNGNHFCHPDREAIARIIKYGRNKDGASRPSLHFNYRSKYNEVWARPDLQEQYRYEAIYPEAGKEGLHVALLGQST
ncbi:MAG: CHAT domain-containing protein [Verrucomicrobia bacterium]|nr:CHAT domain-containing protein [Verrucomicrobiota bacterium]